MASSNIDMSRIATGFSLDVYKKVAERDNVFLSPTSMLVVMAMLHVGAEGNTLNEMSDVLKFGKKNKTDVQKLMKDFTSTLQKGNASVTLQSANRLYPHSDKTILKEYIEKIQKHFGADVRSMDYSTKFEEARQEINKWIEQETKDKIKKLLPAGSLDPLTAMVVVNAIYFKGNWATQFDKGATAKADFHGLTGPGKVDMMFKNIKKAKFGEQQNLDCKVLELPYEGEKLSMVILLPNAVKGLADLEKQLTVENLQEAVSDVDTRTVDVSLPRFKLESSFEMKKVLMDLGMRDAFSAKSDFSSMSKSDELYVSQVFHKAFVDVNEEGTEAAAATAAAMRKRCMPPPTIKFVADHPFMFMIWDHRLEAPLFIGRYVQPSPTAPEQARDEL